MIKYQTASDKFVGSVILFKDDNKLYSDKELTKEVSNAELLDTFNKNNVLIAEETSGTTKYSKVLSMSIDASGNISYSTESGGGSGASDLPVIVFTINEECTEVTCNKTFEEIEKLGINCIISCQLKEFVEWNNTYNIVSIFIKDWKLNYNNGDDTLTMLKLNVTYDADYVIDYDEDELSIRTKPHIG